MMEGLHIPMHYWPNGVDTFMTPAEICGSCSDVAHGNLVPISFCPRYQGFPSTLGGGVGMNLIEATVLATQEHDGQFDKAGVPYLYHVIAVRDMLRGEDEDVQIAGVLHDIVEDTGITLEDLRDMGASERVIAAVDSVTRRQGEKYMELIARARANPDGRKVKLADNTHNTMRLGNLPREQAESMGKKYARARAVLLA